MPKVGEIIKFDMTRNFKYEKPIGNGGTGDTHLFLDETTDIRFAFKKYVPKDEERIEENYIRFKDEIKILFNLSHPNIVRIYNYYLYPKHKTGYIQMEYIEGVSIDEFADTVNDYEDVFLQTINGFKNLQNNNILHRDIRPANILVNTDKIVKIIDFGFGKQIDNSNVNQNSVILNWPASTYPMEITQNLDYTHQTEIFFLGKLFQNIIDCFTEKNFKYNHIIDKMIKINPVDRYESFFEIQEDIRKYSLDNIDFSSEQIQIYQDFANSIYPHLKNHLDNYLPKNDIDDVIQNIKNVIDRNCLEEFLQNNIDLISCFINNAFEADNIVDIPLSIIKEFYNFLINQSTEIRRIILDNLQSRLSNIIIEFEVPF
ncbi:MAG: protein kinase [Oscillospiraceae bacterium]|jgi:serine/threonine-protein kinase|nr:protein kinase [Oscillospiraceae bacterium]